MVQDFIDVILVFYTLSCLNT